jgi:hypothetical protein
MWKVIEGHDNYEISNNGEIKNIKTGRILKPYNGKITLINNNKKYSLYISKLVREYFATEYNDNWVSVPDFSKYEVNSKGYIRHKTKLNILKPIELNGYLCVRIVNDDNIFKQMLIHRIVALSFLENDDIHKIQVNHKDGNKHNNILDNLEWVTPQENTIHSIDSNLKTSFKREVHLIDLEGNIVFTFKSCIEAEQNTGFSNKHISRYCKEKSIWNKKFMWKYSEDREGRTDIDMSDSINEIWKMYDNSNYEISTNGRVRNILTKYIVKKLKNTGGREYIKFSNKHHLIHRLVALTFLPNDDDLPEVNHKDKNPQNNKLENLEWISSKNNIRHSHAKKVVQMDLQENIIKIWDSMVEAEIETKTPSSAISNCCRNKQKTAKSFKWKFAD